MNMAQASRLRTLDCLLEHYGEVGRPVLMDLFGISTPQASHDIKAYLEVCPNNMAYDKTRRTYVKLSTFERKFP